MQRLALIHSRSLLSFLGCKQNWETGFAFAFAQVGRERESTASRGFVFMVGFSSEPDLPLPKFHPLPESLRLEAEGQPSVPL